MKRLLGVYMMTLLMIAAPVSSEEKETSQLIDYFPLQTGNSWTYIRTEEQGQVVSNWAQETILRTGTVYNVRGRQFPEAPGTTTEVYTVGESIELDPNHYWNLNPIHFWNIKINDEAVRDGRYGDKLDRPRRILWGKKQLNEGNILVIVEEVTVHLSTMATIPSEAVHKAELLIAPPKEGIGVKTQRGNAEIVCRPMRETVNVQAGSFANCLVMVTSGDGLESGWETHSYYAPNVGLVQEVQRDSGGNVTYTLTLKDYKIITPSGKQEQPPTFKTPSVPATSVSAMEADKAVESVVKKWHAEAVLVDLFADYGVYSFPKGASLLRGGLSSGKANVFRWRRLYRYQEKYLTVVVSKYFLQFQEGNPLPDGAAPIQNWNVPIQNWKIDSDQAISIAEQNEAIPWGIYFRLAMWKYNDKLLPFWTMPYMLPDQRLFLINATTGQILIGVEGQVTPP
jgi:hypothetical protein